MNYKSLTILDPPILWYPFELEVGKEWVSETKYKWIYIDAKGKETGREEGYNEGHNKYNHVVTKKEKITIPSIGEVECFVIETRSRSGWRVWGVKELKREWFSPGIGVVKSEKHTRGALGMAHATDRSILKEYHIEE